jgi:hypothetical protein
MATKAQNTQIFFLKAGSPSEAVKLGRITGFDGLGGTASEIDASHLESVRREFLRGLRDGGTVSITILLDPTEDSHSDFFALDDDGDPTAWCVALSDGTAAPTVSVPGVFVPPANRSSFIFSAFVQQATISGQVDGLVEVSAQLRVTGDIARSLYNP